MELDEVELLGEEGESFGEALYLVVGVEFVEDAFEAEGDVGAGEADEGEFLEGVGATELFEGQGGGRFGGGVVRACMVVVMVGGLLVVDAELLEGVLGFRCLVVEAFHRHHILREGNPSMSPCSLLSFLPALFCFPIPLPFSLLLLIELRHQFLLYRLPHHLNRLLVQPRHLPTHPTHNFVTWASVSPVLQNHVADADEAEVVSAVEDDLGGVGLLAGEAGVGEGRCLGHRFEVGGNNK